MRRVVLAALLALAACTRPPPPPEPQPRYEVGQGYQLGGVWSYPREDFTLNETGLAIVQPVAAPRRTTNGEIFDAGAMMAAHRTLQLPAIIRVTNMENGRVVVLRVNDRGPSQPGRILAVSAKAAELLGVRAGATFQARVQVEAEPSRALSLGLVGDQPRLNIQAAPVGQVERESLDAPSGARVAAARGATSAPRQGREIVEAATPDMPPLRLPERYENGYASPGRLVVDVGNFFTRSLADRLAARVGGRTESVGPRSRQQEYRVRMGPYTTPAEADAAWSRARQAGVPDPRIVVE
ncbi:SPOR domain-containing protein [Rhodovarius crocodyli]|uniref:Endolytic peptidoglycan transglycosylase RlpA n=1 Tax=Rhodovarius crocodyli TaxID=1979269 RepID=A0A437ME74_9PROT|nr:RlpA-like double-psi beta-barrel domain-containing protein [Rhodovarius crocodyli]RVT95947.1 SPOR domain-containing protein [Rhodovarius crocodyli]